MNNNIEFLKTATEIELREYEVKFPDSMNEVIAVTTALTERGHDYGTCVYAMSISGLVAFYYAAHVLGTTGFQSSCADLDLLKRTRSIKMEFRLSKIEDLMYPQYCNEEHFPSIGALLDKHKVDLAEEAKKRLAEDNTYTHKDVLAHWESLVSLATYLK